MRTEEELQRIEKRLRSEAGRRPAGLRIARRYTTEGVDPFDAVRWERRTAAIADENGGMVFEQRDVTVPDFWSAMATNVVVSKYFRGPLGSPERETSVRQVIGRVVETIARWGRAGGYFADETNAAAFEAELAHILLHQMASFNSPVWFNVGIEAHPQCSACFILSLEDNMQSIMDRATSEAMLFKYGSGSGINFSALRSSKEQLAGGGTASGPVSFMKGFDAFAGVIKSGGKTRRAAKMVILNVDHPDLEEFVWCKANEEQKAWKLIEVGYDGGLNGEAYASVFFQNSNNSVRVTDEFMRAVLDDAEWSTRRVTDGKPAKAYRARELMRQISEAAWLCGDPGMQYDTTVNAWHTSANTARINASNPCSEYMFLDDTACNLASLNLMKFVTAQGEFDVDSFRHAVGVLITAQEILVDSARYPTPKIGENSKAFRPLGLGYANLGALLMSRGLPYDSDAGRAFAGAVTALMCGEAYAQSARVAERLGPFAGFPVNREPMLDVMRKHRAAVDDIDPALAPPALLGAARRAWDDARALGEQHGYRNSQATVLAPTGTIAFMMDCDTTGVEPDIALVKYKKLVGGGLLRIVNQTVPAALRRLGYVEDAIQRMVAHIDLTGTIEGSADVRPEHLPVFDCAFKPEKGKRTIGPMGHVRMMAATQPFISGAISKTVNLPAEATPADIQDVYIEAWRLGLKAIAIYRDGCKKAQPLATDRKEGASVSKRAPEHAASTAPASVPTPRRRRLPDERRSITHKFSVAGHEGYITVGMYDDGSPGELFIRMAKEGSTVSGLMDSFATVVSLTLQYGVPLRVLIEKFAHTRFEPSGPTTHEQIPVARSIMDYLARWLALKFLPSEESGSLSTTRNGGLAAPNFALALEHSTSAPPGVLATGAADAATHGGNGHEKEVFVSQADAPPCHECGSIMVRSGSCYRCLNCGATSGCS